MKKMARWKCNIGQSKSKERENKGQGASKTGALGSSHWTDGQKTERQMLCIE